MTKQTRFLQTVNADTPKAVPCIRTKATVISSELKQ